MNTSTVRGRIQALTFGCLLSFASLHQPALSAQAPTEDGLWYYEIGGAEPVSPPANPSVVSVTLGRSASLTRGHSCGKFDPKAAVTHTLNQIASGAEQMMNAMTTAATAAIAALPALILQRANPGLYDLFQNALLRAEATLELATKSCEQMEAEIAAGKNPYADLITLSKGSDWKLEMGIGGNDVVSAKKSVEASNGSNGVPWIGGDAGGSGQPELRFTGDIVEAGYNLNMNRPVTAAGPVPAASATRLSELWNAPSDARNWVVDVVGENIVTTCDTCRKDSVPGTGLLPKLHQESSTVTADLRNLVSGATPLTLANLEDVTAPGTAITRQVVEAIRDMPTSEQGLIIGRLVSEIGTARTLEKALYARRLLLTGRQVPEVYATEVAREHAQRSIEELDREIDSLLFETRVRKEVVSSIDNWREPAEGGEFGTVTGLSLRRMEIELFIALLVVVLAGQPAALTPLNAGTLSYSPIPTLGNPSPPAATVAAPQSTYGSTGFTGSPATVNVPVWWYAVLAMTSGFNHAVVEGLPAASDLRTFEQQVRLATIADAKLRQEASDFFSECYVPARSKYQAERPATAAVNATLANYGDDDPDWMGSHVYRSTAGYYDRLRPSKQIPGWAYDPARDTEYDPASPPTWGKPTCKEWWEDAGQGLRKQLMDEADATSSGFSGLDTAVAPTLAGEQRQDAVARTVLNNAPPVWSSNDLVANNTGTTGLLGTAENLVKGGLAAGGVLTASALFSVTMTAVLQALPMVQALLLLGVYALLPLVVVLSRYSLSMMVIGAMAIFTVKFWSVLWYLAMWVDQNLIQSMYPDVNLFLQIFANPGEHDTKRMLLNMITTSLYLGLPLLWSGMMAWAGVKVGWAISNAVAPLAQSGKDAGQQGGAIARSAASKGMRR